MEFEFVRLTVSDGIATIRINRPEALNALCAEVNRDIASALSVVNSDKAIRALILTGDARAFAAGADVKEMAEATPRFAREFTSVAVDINNTLESMPIPTIAAVSGYAFGGGCEMTLACDFRVGGRHTQMSFPEVGLGIIPGANGCARAVSLVGAAKARELIMLTPVLSGEEAYRIGLLTVFATSTDCDALCEAEAIAKKALAEAKASGDDAKIAAAKRGFKAAGSAAGEAEFEVIYAKALELAKTLAAKPKCAIAAAKAVINKAALSTVESGKERESAEVALLFDTHDQKEGMAAMLEKRAPIFTNS